MRTFAIFILLAASIVVRAANPSFQSFDTNDFELAGPLTNRMIKARFTPSTNGVTYINQTFITNVTAVYQTVSNIVAANIVGETQKVAMFGPDQFSLKPSIVTQNSSNSITVNGNPLNGIGLETSYNIKASNIWDVGNPRYYGADPTGVVDAQAALQASIDASVTNGIITIPRGIYTVGSTLTITNPVHIIGNGATIRMSGALASTVLLSIVSSNVIISGLNFDTTDSVNPPHTAILVQGTGCDNINITSCKFGNVRVRARDSNILDTIAANNGFWLTKCQWNADFTGATGGDTANIIDVRGYNGVHINDNTVITVNEERFAHLSGCFDVDMKGNTFTSAGTAIANSVIDTFANCRRVNITGNTFNITNSTYGIIVQCKPSSTIFSEHDLVNVSDNTIQLSSSAANVTGIGLYGSWGLTDQTLVSSSVTVKGNKIRLWAPNSRDAAIIVRGFNKAVISDNILTRPDRLTYTRSIDAASNQDTTVAANECEYGYIIFSGWANEPAGETYTNALETVNVNGNTISGWNHQGGIYFEACTNLRSALITGNTLISDQPSDSSGAVYFYNCPGVTNLVVTGNSGIFDCNKITKTDSTVLYQTEVGNSWQCPACLINTLDITQDSTNIVVDFSSPYEYWIVNCTTNVYFTATNCVFGKTISIRLRALAEDRTITYDPAWVVMQGTANAVQTYHTAVIEVTSNTDACDSANITAKPFQQNTDDSYIEFRHALFDTAIAYTLSITNSGGNHLDLDVAANKSYLQLFDTAHDTNYTEFAHDDGIAIFNNTANDGSYKFQINGTNYATINLAAGSRYGSLYLYDPSTDGSLTFIRHAAGAGAILSDNLLTIGADGGFLRFEDDEVVAETDAYDGKINHASYLTLTGTAGLRVYHTGTNGLAVLESYATGDAGTPRPVKISGADLILGYSHTPASSSETNYVGAITFDASNLYIWTATNVNKRITLETW